MLSALLKKVYQKTFSIWQAMGFHITPNHYYLPIPDTRTLPESLWTRRSPLVGIDLRIPQMLDLLSSFAGQYKAEYAAFPLEKTSSPMEYFVRNRMFESVDGEILYCMIRRFKPARMVEIGSGFSTLIAAAAIRRNRQEDPKYDCTLVCIEPYPGEALQAGVPEVTNLIRLPVQEVDRKEFDALGPNDILFIDSSHVVRIGGDVTMEYLEIVPSLKPGVLVHSHDIFFPGEYPRQLVFKDRLFFSEQYLLQAFLSLNDRFEVTWGSSCLHLGHPDRLASAFPSYDPKGDWWPRSFWYRRVR
ncbi:MAG TPA: class I SAM-dependent methyltransferase [Planctomycetota bacterium]|nr:class I SAM-dependent methyltransferase [Planctomycetota bacterium]